MTLLVWAGFLALILGLLALDLGVFHRRSHAVGAREAIAWTAFYVALALAFNVAVYFLYESRALGLGDHAGSAPDGRTAALQFFTAWLVEKSLSLDNIFIIALIFANLRVPAARQHRVLFWGVLGALVLRGIMIAAGAEAIRRFEWVVYAFGGVLLLTAVRMLAARHDNVDVTRLLLVRLARRLYTVSTGAGSEAFFVREGGRRAMTPVFVALLAVEGADVVFAVDSIPACFAVTSDPFLVFTSNVFAILGLRSLFFALVAFLPRFRYLKMSLVFLLAYVGVKMMLAHHYPIPTWVSLCIIGGILFVGVVASVTAAGHDTAPLRPPPTDRPP